MVLWRLIILSTLLIIRQLVEGLTAEERGELARKFKYYHDSVRPTDRFNLVQNANGTFFALNSELELLQTHSDIDDDLIVHYNDDRLFVRELPDMLHIPDEFRAWTPALEPADSFGGGGAPISASGSAFAVQKSTFLDPKTGQITVFYKITGSVHCLADAWKYPFERFSCRVDFLTENGNITAPYCLANILFTESSYICLDERLFLRVVRDLRIDTQRRHVAYAIDEWPSLAVRFSFRRPWTFALVDVYVPSLLVFSVALFAQCKRRKVQVLVTVGSILCLVLIKNAQGESLMRRAGNRLYRDHQQSYGSVTLQDVWLVGLLIHLVCVLTVDLLLPSRRFVYAPLLYDNDESPRPSLYSVKGGGAESPRKCRIATPYISPSARRKFPTDPKRYRSATALLVVGSERPDSQEVSRQVHFQSSPYLFPLGNSTPANLTSMVAGASPPSSSGGGASDGQPAIMDGDHDDDGLWYENQTRADELEYNDSIIYASGERLWEARRSPPAVAAGHVNASYASDATPDTQFRTVIRQPAHPPLVVTSTVRTSPTVHYKHVVVDSRKQQSQEQKQYKNEEQQQLQRRLEEKRQIHQQQKQQHERQRYSSQNEQQNYYQQQHNDNNSTPYVITRRRSDNDHNDDIKYSLPPKKDYSKMTSVSDLIARHNYLQQQLYRQQQQQQRLRPIQGHQFRNGSIVSLQYPANAAGEKLFVLDSNTGEAAPAASNILQPSLYASSPNVRVAPSADRYVNRVASSAIVFPRQAAYSSNTKMVPPPVSLRRPRQSSSHKDEDYGVRHRVERVTMGRKKRRALRAILVGFGAFVVGYVALVAYALMA